MGAVVEIGITTAPYVAKIRIAVLCVFAAAIPRRSLPSVANSALPPQVCRPISSAKVLQFFDICKFSGKKSNRSYAL